VSYIRVKLDSPLLHRGPATVIAVGLEEPEPLTIRVGEVEWQDDCAHQLAPGDRVTQGTFAVRKIGSAP
jgi:hypothetical protein